MRIKTAHRSGRLLRCFVTSHYEEFTSERESSGRTSYRLLSSALFADLLLSVAPLKPALVRRESLLSGDPRRCREVRNGEWVGGEGVERSLLLQR